jgi:peptide/nickel transport system substrate-binding protein
MPEKEPRWRRFQAIKVRRKAFTRSAKRAEGATVRHAHKFIIGRWDNIRSVRRHILTWMFAVAALILVVGIQMVWFQRSYLTAAPVAGGVYAEAVIGPIQTLDPLYATTSAEQSASRLLFSSLYNYDNTGNIHGDLASGMKIDATGKIYTITLRPNVRWQDNKMLTAKDVAFTVALMKNPSARSVMNASWKDINAVATDDHTVQFTLPAAYAAFPQALTFSVLPEHVLKNVDPHVLRESGFSNAPVGSGPFQLRLLQVINDSTGRKIVHMGANDRYYGGRPKLDRFQLHVYGSMDEIATALRTGEVSAAADVTSDVARSVNTNDRYDIHPKPVNSGVYAIINTTQPQLKDVQVRRALQLATNTGTIRNVLYGHPQKLDLPFVKGQLTGDDVPVRAEPNITTANTLLDAAGWKLGTDGIRTKGGEQLKLKVVTRKNSDYERTLEILAGQWRKAGIAIDKQVIDPTAANQNFTQQVLQPRNYDVLVDELVIGGDPDVFAYWHSRGLLNFSNYSNAASDDALVSARSRIDPTVRSAKYKTFAKQWLEDVPAIGLYQSNMLYVQSKQIHSITDDESIVVPSERYADIQYWTAEMGNVYRTP